MTTSATNGDVNDEDVLTQYIILRRDLWREKAWPLGSIAAQVAHASVAALETFKTNEDSIKYVAKEKTLVHDESGFRGERRSTINDIKRKVNGEQHRLLRVARTTGRLRDVRGAEAV